MDDPPDPNKPASSSKARFQPRKVDRRSEAERQAAAQRIDREQRNAARAAAAAAPRPPVAASARGRGGRGGRGGTGLVREVVRGAESGAAGPLSGASGPALTAAESLTGPPPVKELPAELAAAPEPPDEATPGTATTATEASSSKRGQGSARARGGRRDSARVAAQLKAEEPPAAASQSSTHRLAIPSKPYSIEDASSKSSSPSGSDSDDALRGPPRDINHSDSASESEGGTGDEGPRQRPMKIPRHEHVERIKSINTDATTAGSARVRAQALKAAAAGLGPGSPVKTEPDVAMPDAAPGAKGSPEILPQSTPAFQTDEERAEHGRVLHDQAQLLGQLGPVPSDDADADAAALPHPRHNRVFLFQLPPILPNLVPVPSDPPAQPPAPAPAASTRKKGKQKVAFATSTSEAAAPAPAPAADAAALKDGTAFAAPDAARFSGRVGTLRVFADGAAELDWGGLGCEVRRGQVGTMLQEVLAVDEPGPVAKEEPLGEMAAEDKEQDAPSGRAMGQLAGSFVVTPGWASLLEKAG